MPKIQLSEQPIYQIKSENSPAIPIIPLNEIKQPQPQPTARRCRFTIRQIIYLIAFVAVVIIILVFTIRR